MTRIELIYLFLIALANSFVIIGWNKATYFEYESEALSDSFKSMKDLTCWEKGLKKSFKGKMIFWQLRYYSLKYIGDFWSKPLFTCCTCMASFHSLYFYWAIMPFDLHSLIIYPFYIVGLAGVVSVVNNYA